MNANTAPNAKTPVDVKTPANVETTAPPDKKVLALCLNCFQVPYPYAAPEPRVPASGNVVFHIIELPKDTPYGMLQTLVQDLRAFLVARKLLAKEAPSVFAFRLGNFVASIFADGNPPPFKVTTRHLMLALADATGKPARLVVVQLAFGAKKTLRVTGTTSAKIESLDLREIQQIVGVA